MPHPLVVQLRFTRSEWKRSLDGLSDADARQQLPPMNCISWNIGHLAWQEQRYWLKRLQGKTPLPRHDELFGYDQRAHAGSPPLAEMWKAWQTITQFADPYLDTLTTEHLLETHYLDDQTTPFTAGNLLLRTIYHYWYHLGENMAIRQMLGHTDLPEFVGEIDDEAPYRPA